MGTLRANKVRTSDRLPRQSRPVKGRHPTPASHVRVEADLEHQLHARATVLPSDIGNQGAIRLVREVDLVEEAVGDVGGAHPVGDQLDTRFNPSRAKPG